MKLIKIFLVFLILNIGCKKRGVVPTPTPPQEETLNISIDPDPGAGIAPSIGSTYTFKLNIISKIPAQGVDITVEFKKEIDNSTISNITSLSNSAQNNLSVSPLSPGVPYIVTITVKSKTPSSSNSATKTFRVVMK